MTPSDLSYKRRIVREKSMFEGKKPVGFIDLDFDVVREIKYIQIT